MSFILTKNAGVPVKYLIEGYVEQDTDRAQLRTDYTLGSKIKVIETGKTYVLTENGWKYLEENSFDPSILDDYYTKEETDELIATLNSFVYVDTLPTENIKTNVIYLVPAEDPGDDDIKDEYLNLDGTSAGWERIGSTKIDLTQYYTKTETDAKFVEKEAGKGLSTNDYTTVEKQKLAGLNASDFATAAQGVKADNAETKNIEQDGRLDTLEDEIIVTKTISGDFLHITDAAAYPAEECITTLEPVQDLHGYSKPWPAGGGGNLLSTGNAFDVTVNDIRFQSDGNGTYTISGDASNSAYYTFDIPEITLSQSSIYVHLLNSIAISTGALEFFYNNTNLGFIAMLSQNRISNLEALSGATINKLRLNFNNGISGSITLQPMLMLTDTVTSYTPYSNECPISGHTGVELTRTGKNLLKYPYDSGIVNANGLTFTPTTDGGLKVQGTATARTDYYFANRGSDYFISMLQQNIGKSLTLHGCPSGGNESTYQIVFQINGVGDSDYGDGVTKIVPDIDITKPSQIYLIIRSGVTVDFTMYPQLELGSTATTYELCTPETHSITFPQAQSPVYGCEVDWTEGVLRVTDVNVDMGTLAWGLALRGYFQATVNAKVPSSDTQLPDIKCSIYETDIPKNVYNCVNDQTVSMGLAATPAQVWVYDTSYNSATAFKAAMSGVQLVYKLATPLEYDLTPEIITLLKDENNIWLDAGTFEKFEYYPNSTIGEQIGELDKRVTDLENQDIETIIDVTVLPTGSAIKNAIYRLATTVESVTTYTYYLGDAENETTTEIPDKDYVDDHIPTYWEGTRAEYEALTEPLPDGTYVYLRDESVDYNELDNLPKINNIELAGNKSSSDLGLAAVGDSYTKAESDARYMLKDSNLTVQNISDFFNLQRTGKVYQVKIPKFASNTTTTCVKTLDNAGLVAEPSTGDVTNRDDYLDIPLFKWYRCNYVRNSAGVPIITAIKGDINYKETGNVDVGSFGMSFYFKQTEDTDYIYWTISDTANETYGLDTPWYGCIDENGNMLPYWCYSAWHGLYSRLGDPCYIFQSYGSMITNYQTKGAGYWGSTIDKISFAVLMTAMKYGQKSSQNVFKGCVDYNFQYVAADKTLTGVTYFPVTTVQAANILVGSTVIVGYAGNNSGALNIDRGQATMRSYADRVNVLKKVDAGNDIIYIYLDTDKLFDTADVEIATGLDSPIYISSIAWNNGSTEKIAGMHDGSLYSNTSGKEPFRLMGIEYMIGAYDAVGNVAMNINSDFSVDFYYADKGTIHSTDTSIITSTYVNAGQMTVDDVGANTWIGDVKIVDGGIYFATTKGTGDSVGCGDIIWKNTGTGWRECLLLGTLGAGSNAGLCNLLCNHGLASAAWNLAASD